jgi:hypothetical protein
MTRGTWWIGTLCIAALSLSGCGGPSEAEIAALSSRATALEQDLASRERVVAGLNGIQPLIAEVQHLEAQRVDLESRMRASGLTP